MQRVCLAIPDTRQEVAVPTHVQGGDMKSSHMVEVLAFLPHHFDRSLSFSLAPCPTLVLSAAGSGSSRERAGWGESP